MATVVPVLGFIGQLLKKIPGAVLMPSHVRRLENKSQASQLAALGWGPSLVFTGNGKPSMRPLMLYVGSGMDAALAQGSNRFDLVVNCSEELEATRPATSTATSRAHDASLTRHPPTIDIPMRDNEHVRLQETRLRDVARRVVNATTLSKDDDGVADRFRPVRVLVHCMWGASRSVAVAIWLLHFLLDTSRSVDDWYEIIRHARPSVNLSVRLHRELKALFASSSRRDDKF
jgi:predicted protein tyrosine phosphatase